MIVRAAQPTDQAGICAVERVAFGQPDEGELADRLRADGAIVHELVADDGDRVVGHVIFSRMTVHGAASGSIAALGPVAVAPSAQRDGIGSALIEEGLARCRQDGVVAVFVLGDPVYYGRFGFDAALAAHVRSPYAGPAFQALELQPRALRNIDGVDYPAAFASLGE